MAANFVFAEGIGVYHSIYITFDLNGKGDLLLGENHLRSRMGDGIVDREEEELFYALKPEGDITLAQMLQTQARIITLLSRVAEETACSEQGHQMVRMRRIQGALRHIHLHYAEPITEEELSAAAGYSVFHFCRLFREQTGLTPTRYIRRYRVEKARALLIATDESVELIMEKTGFHYYSYFWRSFCQIYGCSPSEYRKKAGGNNTCATKGIPTIKQPGD